MIRQYELVERVRNYNPHTDEDLLNRAYVYAMRAHGLQKRASGDPYFSHPLEVASILTGLKLDDATIVAAVLHDTIEDTDSTREEIDRLFGAEIGHLVEGLTKIKKLDVVSRQTAQAENFRKLLLAIAQDVRVLLVKLADRLHNMRTLHFVARDKATRIAEETLDIYGPLAGRMGMQSMREELEWLAFRHLSPEAEATIRSRLAELHEKNGAIILKIEAELREELASRDIPARVTGRQKSPYSVWRKMERKSLAFEQLSDIYGFRIVVGSADDCYRVLGAVHTKWRNVPERFKDYISTPKGNDYQSLHTTVVGPGHQRVELQVRSEDMDEVACDGIAAHFFYKDRPGAGLATYNGAGEVAPRTLSQESGAYRWLQRTLALLAEGDSPDEFLEHTKLELFHDQVFCFTPKGRLIALPRGATVIDFAYAVHTDVGNAAVGAKINGSLAPLMSELSNGDEVEIVRAEKHVPPPAWETIAVTGKARAAIRRATRDAARKQYAGLGRQIVVRAFDRARHTFEDTELKAALPRLRRTSVDEVLTAVGRGEMFSGDVLKAVFPEAVIEARQPVGAQRSEGGWFGLKKASRLIFKDDGGEDRPSAIPIRGQKGDLPVRFAPQGGAVPGDRIVGIRMPGEGITIYPIQSPALSAFDQKTDLWLDVRWDVEEQGTDRFPAQIKITSINEPGTLGIVTTLIGETGANIDNLAFVTNSPDFNDIIIDLDVYNLKHLTDLISRLRAQSVVSRVERIYA